MSTIVVSDLRDKLLNILPHNEDDAMSATAISKAVGYSKINGKVVAALEEMLDDDECEAVKLSSGRYIYYIDSPESEYDEEYDDEKEGVDPHLNTEEMDEIKLKRKTNHGYKMKALTSRKREVTFPDGDSTELSKGERLLVINEDSNYRFVVQTPDDVFRAIQKFTEDKGLASFIVTDMSTGKAIGATSEIEHSEEILFLGIQRYNKAGY